MESHCDLRRGTAIWQLHDQKVVQPLMAAAGFLRYEEDANWLQRLCGILDVNSFEVRTPNFEVNIAIQIKRSLNNSNSLIKLNYKLFKCDPHNVQHRASNVPRVI